MPVNSLGDPFNENTDLSHGAGCGCNSCYTDKKMVESLPLGEQEMINRFEDKWNWNYLSENTGIYWNLNLLKKYETKWNWKNLSANISMCFDPCWRCGRDRAASEQRRRAFRSPRRVGLASTMCFRHRRRESAWLVSGAHGVRAAGARWPFDPGRSAFALDAENAQYQGQATGVVSPIRTIGTPGRCRGMV